MITINGMSLTVEQVAAVARNYEQVVISEEAKQKVNKARAYVEKKLDEKAVVYGLTTGFGKFSDKYISIEDTARLQRNLIISHSCGMGNPLPTEAVRAAMPFAAATPASGFPQLRPCLQCSITVFIP